MPQSTDIIAESSESGAPTAVVASGAVRGVAHDGLNVFKGIPYARVPSRWKPPAEVEPWDGVRDATEFGPACVQPPRRGGSIYDDEIPALGEDCLSLNIWTPEDADGAPVFVWIHGGSLNWGASSEKMYDGAHLARRGIVVVSINYRLGIFGYLAHPELSAESPDGISGNYGLLDQIVALKWVRQNIAAFGGDAKNVTVAGESAGGLSVLYLMASPKARGLFDKAVAQSAYMISTPELKERRFGHTSAEAIGVRTAKAIGAASIAEMRAMDAFDLATKAVAAGYLPFGTIDGQILPRQIVDVFEAGEQAPVPLLAGFNSGEIRSLRFLQPQLPESAAAYEAVIRERLGDLADAFLALYPAANIDESTMATLRDAMYGWTAEKMARSQGQRGVPAFLYLFDHGYPAAEDAGLHGFHASELPYLFGTQDRTPPLWPKIPETAAEVAISDAMADYWASFAHSGVPQAEDVPDWPAFSPGGGYMHFAETPKAQTDLLPGAFALHDEIVRRRRASGDTPWNWNVGIATPVPGGQGR